MNTTTITVAKIAAFVCFLGVISIPAVAQDSLSDSQRPDEAQKYLLQGFVEQKHPLFYDWGGESLLPSGINPEMFKIEIKSNETSGIKQWLFDKGISHPDRLITVSPDKSELLKYLEVSGSTGLEIEWEFPHKYYFSEPPLVADQVTVAAWRPFYVDAIVKYTKADASKDERFRVWITDDFLRQKIQH